MQTLPYIWFNGKISPWADCNVHIMTHALHYGSSVFEGVRCYQTPKGPQIFRLQDHTSRLFDSARVYRMKMPYDADTLNQAQQDIIVANKLGACYLRPLIWRGSGSLGLSPRLDEACQAAIIAVEWGSMHGASALEDGIDVCISSWNRLAPNTMPPAAKAGGNYLSSQLISMEAKLNGYDQGIGLSVDGKISEGAGENLFLIRNGKIFTPPGDCSILPGLTRDTIVTLARQAGFEVIEQGLTRESLYFADEIFLTGTAAEVTPVRSVDRIPVGSGKRGPVTQQLQKAFFGLFDGTTKDQWNWLTPVESKNAAAVAV